MIVKKQIYANRCLETRPHINSIKYQLSQYYKAEKLIHTNNGRLTNFDAKWDIIQNCFENFN